MRTLVGRVYSRQAAFREAPFREREQDGPRIRRAVRAHSAWAMTAIGKRHQIYVPYTLLYFPFRSGNLISFLGRTGSGRSFGLFRSESRTATREAAHEVMQCRASVARQPFSARMTKCGPGWPEAGCARHTAEAARRVFRGVPVAWPAGVRRIRLPGRVGGCRRCPSRGRPSARWRSGKGISRYARPARAGSRQRRNAGSRRWEAPGCP
jgi:hypothetical protein